MLRRPYDLAAIALVLAATLVWVEAGWQPPRIDPSQASAHIGERVQVEGMVVELRHFSDGGGRMVLADGGAALHVIVRDTGDVVQEAWVVAEGSLRRDGGMPLLEAEATWTTAVPEGDEVPLVRLATRPADHVDRLVRVPGTAGRGVLEDAGHRVRLVGEAEEGPQRLDGILRYDTSCLCYAFHVGRPWQP